MRPGNPAPTIGPGTGAAKGELLVPVSNLGDALILAKKVYGVQCVCDNSMQKSNMRFVPANSALVWQMFLEYALYTRFARFDQEKSTECGIRHRFVIVSNF
jgi:hypothetical protein